MVERWNIALLVTVRSPHGKTIYMVIKVVVSVRAACVCDLFFLIIINHLFVRILLVQSCYT